MTRAPSFTKKFNRASLLAAWSRQAQEETVRETGWLHVWRKPRKT